MERRHAESVEGAEVVEGDHSCAKCGYSLRTLRLDGVCPECGLAVARSLLDEEDRVILAVEDRLLAELPKFERWRKRLGMTAIGGVATFVVMHLGALAGLPVMGSLLDRLSASAAVAVAITVAITAAICLLIGILAALGWYGCRVRCQHAEYVRMVRQGGDATRTESGRRLDDRIVGREQTYETNAGCAKVMLVLFLLAIVSIPVASIWLSVPLRLPEVTIMMLTSWLFWASVMMISIWTSHGRLAHARSIRYYRRLGRDRRSGGAASTAERPPG